VPPLLLANTSHAQQQHRGSRAPASLRSTAYSRFDLKNAEWRGAMLRRHCNVQRAPPWWCGRVTVQGIHDGSCAGSAVQAYEASATVVDALLPVECVCLFCLQCPLATLNAMSCHA
jgi:hypothetical protein